MYSNECFPYNEKKKMSDLPVLSRSCILKFKKTIIFNSIDYEKLIEILDFYVFFFMDFQFSWLFEKNSSFETIQISRSKINIEYF